MKKEEFLYELEGLLGDLPEAERREAMEFYRDYLDDIGDDVDALEAVGSPEKVAQRVKAGLAGNPEEEIEYTDRGYRDQFDEQETAYPTPRGRRRDEGEKRDASAKEQSGESREKDPKTERNNKIGIVILIVAVLMMTNHTLRRLGLLALGIGCVVHALGAQRIRSNEGLRKAAKVALIAMCAVIAVSASLGITKAVLRGLGGKVPGSTQTGALPGELKRIEIVGDAGEIELRSGDVDQVQIEESSEAVCTLKNGELSIKSSDSRNWFLPAVSRVKVVVPEGTKLEKLYVELNAGEVKLQDLAAETVYVEVNAGNCDIRRLSCGKKADVELNAGNADISLVGAYEDYNYQVDVNLGNVIIDENSFAGLSSEKTIENGAACTVSVEVNAGNLDISFEK